MSDPTSTTIGWEPLRKGVWQAIREHPSGWSWRTVAVNLGGGKLCVFSPLANPRDHLLDGLDALGEPLFLLAPNHFHYMGLAAHLERWPSARVVATAQASARLEKKTGLSVEPLDALREALPAHMDALELAGIKSGEAWLSVQTPEGRWWIVCDAFFNVQERPIGAFGFALRLTGTAPGLRIGGTFRSKLLQMGDRATYKVWLLDALAREAPTTLVPCHGEIVSGPDLPERLRALADARL